MKALLIILFSISALAASKIRKITSTSCEPIRINLGLGMSTQIVLEQEPKITLYSDKKHYRISTNELSPRSLAIIPFVETTEIDKFADSTGKLPEAQRLAELLDTNFKTNLFVFFENHNQMMFDLRFVEKKRADYIVKVSQSFGKGCDL
jgi:hypothetical protein